MITLTLKITAPDKDIFKRTFDMAKRHLENHDFTEHASMGMGGNSTYQGTIDMRVTNDAPEPPLTHDEIRKLRNLVRNMP